MKEEFNGINLGSLVKPHKMYTLSKEKMLSGDVAMNVARVLLAMELTITGTQNVKYIEDLVEEIKIK